MYEASFKGRMEPVKIDDAAAVARWVSGLEQARRAG
jgi:hypothetical protein